MRCRQGGRRITYMLVHDQLQKIYTKYVNLLQLIEDVKDLNLTPYMGRRRGLCDWQSNSRRRGLCVCVCQLKRRCILCVS